MLPPGCLHLVGQILRKHAVLETDRLHLAKAAQTLCEGIDRGAFRTGGAAGKPVATLCPTQCGSPSTRVSAEAPAALVR